MFGKDTKYLGHSPGVFVQLVVFLSLFSFLAGCSHFQSDSSTSSSNPGSSSDSSNVEEGKLATASQDTEGYKSSPETRDEGFEYHPKKIEGVRTFELKDHFTIGPVPEEVENLEVWLEVPQRTPLQVVQEMSVDISAPYEWKLTEESLLRNQFLYINPDELTKREFEVTITSRVSRQELRGFYQDPMTPDQRKHFLSSTPNIPVGPKWKKEAEKRGVTGEGLEFLKGLYNFVINNSTYYKANPKKFKSGPGKAEYCLFQGQGGCTDFHALYLSMGRSRDIPNRFVIGSFLPESFDGKDRDVAYHCWAEAYLDGKGWYPLDAAYGDLWPEMKEYYFGNLDARRVAFSRGRNIQLQPPASQRIEYFIKGHVEADGKPIDNWNRRLTYREITE